MQNPHSTYMLRITAASKLRRNIVEYREVTYDIEEQSCDRDWW
jgi:hypothetical protein